MHKHNCVKCNEQYQDEDSDAYLCAKCLGDKAKIAAQIDGQFAGRPKTSVKSGLQEYNEAPKGPGGFMIVKDL